MASKFGGSANCPVCSKRCYPAESIALNNITYHKACLKCVECGKVLSTTQCSIYQNKIYCMAHYRKVSGGGSSAATTKSPSNSSPAPLVTPATVQINQQQQKQQQKPKSLPQGIVISPQMEQKMLAPSTGSLAERVFQKYDEDHDGHIGVGELKKMAMEMGALLSDEELAMAIKTLDKDGNGTLELNEFEDWWRTEKRFEKLHRSGFEMQFLNGAFASFMSFDRDGNGTLDRNEFVGLHQVLTQQGGYPVHEEETDWNDMDRDSSGSISFNEYVEWLLRKAAEAANPRQSVLPQ